MSSSFRRLIRNLRIHGAALDYMMKRNQVTENLAVASQATITGPTQPFQSRIAKIGGKYCPKRKLWYVKLSEAAADREVQIFALEQLTEDGLTVTYLK